MAKNKILEVTKKVQKAVDEMNKEHPDLDLEIVKIEKVRE